MKERFIPFNNIQQRLITEVMERTRKEINEALTIVYEDLGITEELAKGGCSFLLHSDYSGLDVVKLPENLSERKNKLRRF